MKIAAFTSYIHIQCSCNESDKNDCMLVYSSTTDNFSQKCKIAAKTSVGAASSLCSVAVFLQQHTNYKAVNIQSDGTMC